jgi:hypothetical protein
MNVQLSAQIVEHPKSNPVHVDRPHFKTSASVQATNAVKDLARTMTVPYDSVQRHPYLVKIGG